LKEVCDTFRGRGGKNTLSLTTLGQFAQKKDIYNNNDHGVDVSIIMVI
jgi:hypothetical protein